MPAFPTTPSARFTTLTAGGLVLLLAVLTWAAQPASGFTLDLADWRPFQVHPAFWVTLATGFGAYLIAMWIWALKPGHAATRLFALSGVMTLLFTFAATRGFMTAPLPQWLLTGLETTNLMAASGFGVVMICLFLIYPARLPLWRPVAVAVVTVFSLWTLVRGIGPLRNPPAVQLITFCEMVAILLVALWQVVSTRRDPRQRAIAIWLGASVALGAGGFIGTVSVPITFGHAPLIMPYYAFAFFLIIYVGLAIGLVRYRLFELGGWAFQLIFHAGVALAVLASDAVLIGGLSMAPGAALGLSLFGMAFLYMPARDYAIRRLTRARLPDEAGMFRSVVEVALKPSGPQRAESWERLLRDLYQPLELTPAPREAARPAIDEEGLALYLPAVADSPPLCLRYPHAGRALFSQRDLAMSEQIVALMGYAEESRGAYDRGVSEERTRIARDIHDNIGAQLLRALHSGAPERKDAMIRDTLADLRDVINNARHHDLPLDLVLADLRAETADRLSPHGMALVWQVEAADPAPLEPSRIHALRSLVREATSNAIKHARAATVTVTLCADADRLVLSVADDGCGFNDAGTALGHGLVNMKARTESLGGVFSLASTGAGTCLSVRIPLYAPLDVKERLS